MKKLTLFLIFTTMFIASTSFAHFGMLIPSDSMVMQDDYRTIKIEASFSHPFEMVGMPLVKPQKFGVFFEKKNKNLLSRLKSKKIMKHQSFEIDYKINRPGIYVFYMEPKPYFEPAEDCFIIHYTKTYIAAFGDDEGWDEEIGLKTEIVPLSKPFALYAGNVFQGIVKFDGEIVPFAEVEVEYYNKDKKAKAPSDYMITQTIKADKNGVFTYAPPKSGWWGFAALNEADYTLKTKDGKEKGVELGAVLWIKFEDWKNK